MNNDHLPTTASLNLAKPNLKAILIEKPLKKSHPMYNRHFFGVPRVIVVDNPGGGGGGGSRLSGENCQGFLGFIILFHFY